MQVLNKTTLFYIITSSIYLLNEQRILHKIFLKYLMQIYFL